MSREKRGETAGAGSSVAIVAVGDAFSEEDEELLSKAREYLRDEGHTVVRLDRASPSFDDIQSVLRQCMEDGNIASIIVMGRTGVSAKDLTLEAVNHFAEKEMPAFSAVFSMMCYEEVGAPAIVQRAEAFGSEGKAVFVIPLSKLAVKKAVKRLIAPHLSEIVMNLRE